MIITVVNMSDSITDAQLHPVVRAINRQIREDFEPYWSLGATLRLEGKTGSTQQPDKTTLPEMRGDAVLYLWDDPADVANALGYHDRNAKGLPFGLVFKKVADEAGESWTVTLSHEALELVADPLVNLLVAGPHPQENRTVFHWYEMSDAVQGETYVIDGTEVSNFVLPLYFTPSAEKGSRNDFLGNAHDGKTLASFGINPGGYIGFFDPQVNEDVTFALAGDKLAKKRLEAKRANTTSRRSHRIAGWPREEVLDLPAARSRGVPAAAKTGNGYERIDKKD
jgi:hypothetical protein